MRTFAHVEERLIDQLDHDVSQRIAPVLCRQARDTASKEIPLVTHAIVDNGLAETEVPVTVQWDIFAYTRAAAYSLREQVLEVVYSDYPMTMEPFVVRTEYVGGRKMPDPDVNVTHLQFDIEYRPYREYQPLAS